MLKKLIVVMLILWMTAACAIFESREEDLSYNPNIDPKDFITGITNPYFGLVPGNLYIYEGQSDEGLEHIEVYITDQTKEILGVTCTVVHDTVWLDGQMVEDTLDWYAEDINGDVWYFGEWSTEYENGKEVSNEGSWEAGVDGAKPGILIKRQPRIGDEYRQEYYFNEAEDMAKVISLTETITTPLGLFEAVLQTEEWNPLEKDSHEYKYYAKGIGMILEQPIDDDEEIIQLIEIKTLEE